MAKKRNAPKIKPVEEWGAKEWEAAYNVLTRKYEALREAMRISLKYLNKAI